MGKTIAADGIIIGWSPAYSANCGPAMLILMQRADHARRASGTPLTGKVGAADHDEAGLATMGTLGRAIARMLNLTAA